ncbi:hypothetical protein I6I68_00605 [Corynebacterium glucuronolyticum]|uniref:hypothetical protein n=1 Tax=Corynebacterium glucuronolyticum TaxID=39791 RepID=UPI00191F4FE7|nr:hypothetical protein [Corynebacterium glucuronolyticum]QQU88540.1 hypothetical protein I6I68_00605 [Corynebacterium glucuronolyticum]
MELKGGHDDEWCYVPVCACPYGRSPRAIGAGLENATQDTLTFVLVNFDVAEAHPIGTLEAIRPVDMGDFSGPSFEKDFGTGPTVGVIAVTVGEHYGLESMARPAGMERAFQRFPFWALTYSADGSWGIVGTSFPVEYEDFDKRAIPAHPRPLFTPSADLGEL